MFRTDETLRAIAETIDKLYNGDARPKKVGFCLHVFLMGEPEATHRVNYVSNVRREDMIKALEDWIAQAKGEKPGASPDHTPLG